MDTCSYDVYKLLAEIKENNKFKWRFLPSKEKRQKKTSSILAIFVHRKTTSCTVLYMTPCVYC